MKKNYFVIGLIFLTFFVISLLTNILGPIIPEMIEGFELSLGMAGFLPFAFFIAYGVMSIPAGMLVDKYKEKVVMTSAFVLATFGALLFAFIPTFAVALPSLFLIGIGMAMLQVAINPLLRTAGGEEHFAFNSVMAQLVFGVAGYYSPQLYSYLVKNIGAAESDVLISTLSALVPENLPWVSIYWIFTIVAGLMVITLGLAKLPKVELKDDEKAGAWDTHKELFKNKQVILFFFGIFCYVGLEQGVANWISEFLRTYHGLDPQTVGADTISNFWLFLTFGCLLGLVLLKFIDSRKVLVVFAFGAVASLLTALFGSADLAIYSFISVGFCASVMWSIIFSLALNSVPKHHGSFSGILCTGIIGGAVVPAIVGWIGDFAGLKFGMFFLFIPLGYILSIGFWAKPIITNETISLKKKKLAVNEE